MTRIAIYLKPLICLLCIQFLSQLELCAKVRTGREIVDSLIDALPSLKTDTDRVNTLYEISSRLENASDARKYAKMALEIAKKEDWKPGLARAYNALGRAYTLESDYVVALENYSRALSIYEDIGDREGRAKTYNIVGMAYYKQSKYPLAVDYYLKALKINQELGVKMEMAINLLYLGRTYSKQKDYLHAEEYYLGALKIFEEARMKDARMKGNVALTQGNLGEVYRNMGRFADALEYDNKALAQFEASGDKGNIANNLGNIGEVNKALGKFDLALDFTFRALKIVEEMGDREGIAYLSGNIGENYLAIACDTMRLKTPAAKSENMQQAIAYLTKAIAIAKEIKAYDPAIEFSKYLAKAYQLSGNYQKALELTNEYQAQKDSIFSAENLASINSAERKYYLDLKDKDIALRDAQFKKGRIVLIFSGVVILLLVVVVFGIVRSNLTQKKLNARITHLVDEQEKIIAQRTAALAHANAELRELIQYSAHNLREPLTRILGSINIKEDVSDEEFSREIWPHMKKAANDLDTIIKEVITRADKAV